MTNQTERKTTTQLMDEWLANNTPETWAAYRDANYADLNANADRRDAEMRAQARSERTPSRPAWHDTFR